MRFLAIAGLGALLAACASGSPPAVPARTDADTRAWWAITAELSSDAMEGRDTGSTGYAEAGRRVVEMFARAGLKPGGESGTWVQTIPLQEIRVETEGTRFMLAPEGGGRGGRKLAFLHQISVRATDKLPARIEGQLAFRGYCAPGAMGDVRNKVAVCFGARRAGQTTGGERVQAAADAGALGLINVDDPGFTIEPPRWPDAYARSVGFRDAPPPAYAQMPVMRLSGKGFTQMLEGSGMDARAILAEGAASRGLPSFDLPTRLEATFKTSKRLLLSENILALLPGTDPKLKDDVLVVSAHLDGYGFGEAVNGDRLYNGAFDDAAYVATLVRLAETRAGKGFRRSVLFAAFTGEEKGLLGATWFTQHPTVPKERLVADINLDQLRPLFPLKILTMHAVDDTTLGAAAKAVAAGMGVEIRKDLEPERNLNSRADHYPFLRAGVPATGFVFGYEPGTDAERRYREWYQERYHRPQDDMSQPIDFIAARDINTFFYRLAGAVADADAKPEFLPGSPFRLR
jgi:hypothetical protein